MRHAVEADLTDPRQRFLVRLDRRQVDVAMTVRAQPLPRRRHRAPRLVDTQLPQEEARVEDREVAPPTDGQIVRPREVVLRQHRDELHEVVDVARHLARQIQHRQVCAPHRQHPPRHPVGPHQRERCLRSLRAPEEPVVEPALEHPLATAPEHPEHEGIHAVLPRQPEASTDLHRIPVVVFPQRRHPRLPMPREPRPAFPHQLPLREPRMEGLVALGDRVPPRVDVRRDPHRRGG